MLRGIVYLAVIFLAFISTAAFACDGQIGKIIYEDTFTDDSGGWDFTANVAMVKPPNFVFTLDSKNSNITSQVLTFHTGTDGDYCAEVILPKLIAPDNKYNFAVSFWATDYANFWMAMLSSDGSVTLFSKDKQCMADYIIGPQRAGVQTRSRRRQCVARDNSRRKD